MISASFLFCAGQAHASGGWLLTYTATGSSQTTPSGPGDQPYSASGSGTNSVTVSPRYTSGFGLPGGVSTSLSVTVTVTGTWQGSDPAPPSVKVVETAKLDEDGQNGDGSLASGTLTDPWGDPTVNTTVGSQPDAICQTPGATPIQHLSTQSGSSFTLTRTFSASSSATSTPPQACSAAAHFDSYTVSIHPQPYAIQVTNVAGHVAPVTIKDDVVWKSTDGNIADLSACIVYETLTFPGGDPYQYPAPFTTQSHNPTTYPDGANAQGSAGVIHDLHLQPLWQRPIVSCPTFNTSQTWYFMDGQTGEKDVPVPTKSGPYTIGHSLAALNSNPSTTDQSQWWFTTTLTGPDGQLGQVSGNLWEP